MLAVLEASHDPFQSNLAVVSKHWLEIFLLSCNFKIKRCTKFALGGGQHHDVFGNSLLFDRKSDNFFAMWVVESSGLPQRVNITDMFDVTGEGTRKHMRLFPQVEGDRPLVCSLHPW